MRVTTAMLADSAQVQGGKLFVLGGGFDTITTRSLPAVHRSLAVVLVVMVGPDERHRDLEIHINLLDEDGQEIGLHAQGKLRVGAPPNLPPGASSTVPMVSSFANVQFPEVKGYVFSIKHEGEELARIPFRVVLAG